MALVSGHGRGEGLGGCDAQDGLQCGIADKTECWEGWWSENTYGNGSCPPTSPPRLVRGSIFSSWTCTCVHTHERTHSHIYTYTHTPIVSLYPIYLFSPTYPACLDCLSHLSCLPVRYGFNKEPAGGTDRPNGRKARLLQIFGHGWVVEVVVVVAVVVMPLPFAPVAHAVAAAVAAAFTRLFLPPPRPQTRVLTLSYNALVWSRTRTESTRSLMFLVFRPL